MKFTLEIQGEDRLLVATVTIITIGHKSAVAVGFDEEPTEGELEAADAAIELLMQQLFHGNSIKMDVADRIDDPAERAASFRKFLGGGQG